MSPRRARASANLRRRRRDRRPHRIEKLPRPEISGPIRARQHAHIRIRRRQPPNDRVRFILGLLERRERRTFPDTVLVVRERERVAAMRARDTPG